MWAAILKVLYEIIATIVKNQSGPITSIAAPAVPVDLRDRWNKRVNEFMRDR